MPEITEEELARLKAAEESAKKLEEKNREILEEKKRLANEKAQIEAANRATQEQALKDKQDYKALAEQLENDRKAREAAEKERTERLAKGAKLSETQKELHKLGINAERVSHALRLVDMDLVKYDDATGVVIGADAAALKIKAALPELFVTADKEKMPQGAGGAGDSKGPKEMTLEWYNSLPEADKKKHYKEFMTARGLKVR